MNHTRWSPVLFCLNPSEHQALELGKHKFLLCDDKRYSDSFDDSIQERYSSRNKTV